MRNIPFVIWMLGWPLMMSFSEYLTSLYRTPTELTAGAAAILIAWFISVGALLYEKK